jgi:hypothetical protein
METLFCLHSCNAEQIHCYSVSLLRVEMFSLSRYYGTVTTCTVNCYSNVDIIASHMQHHQGNPTCHTINNSQHTQFFKVGVFSTRPTTKLEGQPISAVSYCLFNIFAFTRHVWRTSPLSTSCGRARPS